MKHKHTILTVLALVLLAIPAAAGDWGMTEDFKETRNLAAGGELNLENINGNVEIEGWDRDEVEINYTKRSRSQEGLDRMEVLIEENGDRLSISTEYKKSSGRNNNGAVDFTVYVPRGAALELDLVNGNLDVKGHEGSINADLVNGNLTAELAGEAELGTVNGSLDVTLNAMQATGRYELSSVNGGLTLRLPAGAGARVEAETVHGSISNDFGMEVDKGRYVGKSLRGKIGDGGADIELSNVNGSIKIVSQ
jgi:DUF4097 and DUF4098 domain-containing protein YvlB